MIKQCPSCRHTGELSWRDGKYHCAMCDCVIDDNTPQAQRVTTIATENATCPICKNREDNLFNGTTYLCALCGTEFALQQATQAMRLDSSNDRKVQELEAQSKQNRTLGIVFFFLFWPVSIYFFYKLHQINKELKELGYMPQIVVANGEQKPRKVLKGISIFCFFGAAVMLLMTITTDPTGLVGVIIYGIFGVMFWFLSKTPKGCTYLLGKEKGIKVTTFILGCIILLFASVMMFSANMAAI